MGLMTMKRPGRAVWTRTGAAALLLGIALAGGQTQARPQDPYFRTAQRQFLSLEPETRLWFQIFLTSAGHWPAVPNIGYSTRLFEATRRLQAERGEAPTGVLTRSQVTQILGSASSVLHSWDMRRVDHPTRRAWIWLPAGVDLHFSRTADGLEARSWRSRLRIRFEYFPGQNLTRAHEATLTSMIRGGDRIQYQTLKRDFMVVSGRQGPHQRYVRYHDDGSGLIGFDMTWSGEEPPVYGERLATLVSGSLWASMTGAPFPRLDRPFRTPSRGDETPAQETPAQESSPSEPWSHAATPPPAGNSPASEPRASSQAAPPATAQERDDDSSRSVSTGSGFGVSTAGHFLTNAHVVSGCRSIAIRGADLATQPAELLARDETNDLALLRAGAPAESAAVLPLRPGVRLGEAVAAFGFPHSDMLATSGNFTLGNVTALSGLRDDSRYLQISAPVQSGNSGGPLVDAYGNLVGVVTAKLNAIKVMAASGDLPQNVNFAVKSALAASFLDSRQVQYATGGPGERKLEAADLAERARRASVFVTCAR
ncbi:trypsin-like peptidase [Camelimonas lactis]|uniref:Trypsin-like peptidase n=3 Tax=Camelimonas lactis TaxID=659006 RepID=A0A4R2GQV9_9HYPH|nr:trypsin-like peptidase [Camelimonas lactis]